MRYYDLPFAASATSCWWFGWAASPFSSPRGSFTATSRGDDSRGAGLASLPAQPSPKDKKTPPPPDPR